MVDPQARAATHALRAARIADYGKCTWPGHYYEVDDLAHIRDACHLKPANISGDFMGYSLARVAHGSGPPILILHFKQ